MTENSSNRNYTLEILINEIKTYEIEGGNKNRLINDHVVRCEFLDNVIKRHNELIFSICYPLIDEAVWKTD